MDIEKYKSGKWKEYDRYQCPDCPFDSINPELFREHLRKHAEIEAPKVPAPPLLDRFGNKLNQSEEDSENG